MLDFTATFTDYYQLTMAQSYFLDNTHAKSEPTAIFDYFFRTLAFNGGYCVFAGLEDLLNIIENLKFSDKDIEFLYDQGHFHPGFLKYLKNFRFNGTIYAAPEGEIVFPNEPIVSVEANIIEAQIIETVLLNILNFQTLVATKASRMRYLVKDKKLVDFGLRRAQGAGGYYASRAAIIGGFDATSNVSAARDYNIKLSGTMAHSFVQSFDDELSAFRDFAAKWPDNTVFLVDTYNTLKSGIPNAIIVAKELEAKGYRLKGVRLDSGDLAYLTKKSRQLLDDAGLSYVEITVSNQLDEYVIKSLLEQNAPIDVFGVGTNLVVGKPDAALDGVYKLAFSKNKPRMKFSDSLTKTSLPYAKKVYRVMDKNQMFQGADVITMVNEKSVETMHHPFEPLKSFNLKNQILEPLLHKVMEKGKRTIAPLSLQEIKDYATQRLKSLPIEYKRFINPHIYKVGLSEQLIKKRDALIKKLKI